MDIEQELAERIGLPHVECAVLWASGKRANLCRLWELARLGDRRTSLNALWVMTRLGDSDSAWLSSLRDELIDMALDEQDTGRKRMLLQILRAQEYRAEDIRTDFLDFCLANINAECEPYAVRAYCIYAAFKMCRHYPELLAELEAHLDMMSYQPLSPALRSALRQTRSKIARLKAGS